MRMFILAAALVLTLVTPARADPGLTGAVANAYLPRTPDEALHAIAHERVIEISACASCMNHDRMRGGTVEVIGYNNGYADPIVQVIAVWASSPIHDGILSDASYGRIGCAERTASGGDYFVCVLATGPGSGRTLSGGGAPAGGVPALPDTALPDTALPDTAMPD